MLSAGTIPAEIGASARDGALARAPPRTVTNSNNLNLPGTFMLWMKSRSVVPAHSAPSGAGVVSSKCTAFTDPVAMYAVEYAPQER